jgi:hypothetical protein
MLAAALHLSGEKIPRNQNSNRSNRTIKRVDLQPMPKPMGIGLNINTGIILTKRSIMIRTGDFIFI